MAGGTAAHVPFNAVHGPYDYVAACRLCALQVGRCLSTLQAMRSRRLELVATSSAGADDAPCKTNGVERTGTRSGSGSGCCRHHHSECARTSAIRTSSSIATISWGRPADRHGGAAAEYGAGGRTRHATKDTNSTATATATAAAAASWVRDAAVSAAAAERQWGHDGE